MPYIFLPSFSVTPSLSIFFIRILRCFADAYEMQAIEILDIAKAFLHAENDEKIIMLLHGKLAEMVV